MARTASATAAPVITSAESNHRGQAVHRGVGDEDVDSGGCRQWRM
jgi:hypothetical protein